jgi:deoxycytidine triphosphate deaminase
MSCNYLGNEIDMHPVNSSNVLEVGYDLSGETVLVRYTNNSLYAYKGVNELVFEELKTAPSVGSYLARNFKNVYPYERIE